MSKILLVCNKCKGFRVVRTIARARGITYCLECMARTRRKYPVSIIQMSEADFKSTVQEQRNNIIQQTDVDMNVFEEEKERQKKMSAHKLLN